MGSRQLTSAILVLNSACRAGSRQPLDQLVGRSDQNCVLSEFKRRATQYSEQWRVGAVSSPPFCAAQPLNLGDRS
jgi:hypothetical protein